MKMLALVSAGLVATAALAPLSTASAAPRHGWRTKTVCKTTWVHHHKVRRCHKVRVRW
ncbi:MAG TPA: hypothetical protein VF404_08990 [Sphingomonas sp.]